MFSDDQKKKNGALKFDPLEEKLNDNMKSMSIRDKSLSKYGDGEARPTTVEKLRKSFKKNEKKSTHSLNLVSESEKEQMSAKRSSSVDKTNDLTMSLFGAASVVCNIVEISKDSTMKGKNKSLAQSGKKDSIGSDSGKPNGPFSSIKEAQSKKKSVDDED